MCKVLNHIDVLIKELNSDKIKQSEVKLKLFQTKLQFSENEYVVMNMLCSEINNV